jgi:hypothetical protein
MILYAGKSANSPQCHTYDIIMELMGEFETEDVWIEGFLNKGRTLITDNFYTGIPIVERLLELKTRMVGTVNVGRKGLPKGLKKS